MPVTVISRPDLLNSVYSPIEYTLQSSYIKTGVIDSFNRFATFNPSQLNSEYADNVLLRVTPDSPFIGLAIGDTMVISNTGNYDGEYKIVLKNNPAGWSNTINVKYKGPPHTVGNVVWKVRGIRMLVLVQGLGATLQRRIYANANNQFVVRLDKEIRTLVGNAPLDITTGTTSQVDGSATQNFHILYAEESNLLHDNDVSYITHADGSYPTPTTVTPLSDFYQTEEVLPSRVGVNSAVPYMQFTHGSAKGAIANTSTDLSDFTIDSVGPSSVRFLTNSPNTITIGRLDTYELTFLSDLTNGAPTAMHWYIEHFDASNASIATSETLFTTGGDQKWRKAVGPYNITAPALSVKYTVVLRSDPADVELSETFTFLIDDDCARTKTRFMWLNPRGGYDAFTFLSPRSVKSSVKRKTHKQELTLPRVIGNREVSVIDIESMDVMSASTNKVTPEVAEWLQELIESPQVYVEIEGFTEGRIPVLITNKNSAIIDTYNNLFNIRVQYTHSFSKPSIRG